MPLGLLPLGTGGADGLNVGLVSLGTGGGRVPAGVIVEIMSVGANYAGDIRKERYKMRSHTFFPIEDIAQPARAPAAPAAELTSVLSAPPFGVLKPRAGGPSSARVVSGYSLLAEPDWVYGSANKPSWQRAPRVFG
jgi:hypothetical protein